MKRTLLQLMLMFFLLNGNAVASLSYLDWTNREVIYDNLNGKYWFADLSLFTNMNFDQQTTFIADLSGTQSYKYHTFEWHMATEQEILSLSQTYSLANIMGIFKRSGLSTYQGFTQWPSPSFVGNHVIYEISNDIGLGYHSFFIDNYSDASHTSDLGAWVVGVPVSNPGQLPSPICIGKKFRLAGKLFKNYFRCYRKVVSNASFDLFSAQSKAETTFEAKWNRIEARSIYCDSAPSADIQEMVELEAEDIYTQIIAGLDMNDGDAVITAKSFLNAIGRLGNALFAAHSKYIDQANSGILHRRILRAQERFITAWTRIQNRAFINKGVTYTGPSDLDIIASLSNLTGTVLDYI